MNAYSLGALAAAVSFASANTAAQDAQGNYSLSYKGCDGTTATYLFVPANKVLPTVHASLSSPNGQIATYTYRISNASSAAQPIGTIQMVLPDTPANPYRGVAPKGFTFAMQTLEDGGVLLQWSANFGVDVTRAPAAVIAPGGSLSDFGLRIGNLAGFVKMSVTGYKPIQECNRIDCPPCPPIDEDHEMEFPDLDAQLTPLMNLAAEVLVIGPAVTRTDAAGTVLNLKAEVATWVTIAQASTVFVAQVGPKFDALVASISGGNRARAIAAANDLKAFARAATSSDLSKDGKAVINYDIDSIIAAVP